MYCMPQKFTGKLSYNVHNPQLIVQCVLLVKENEEFFLMWSACWDFAPQPALQACRRSCRMQTAVRSQFMLEEQSLSQRQWSFYNLNVLSCSEEDTFYRSSNFYSIVSVFIVGLTIVSSGDAVSYNLVEVDHHHHADGRGLSTYWTSVSCNRMHRAPSQKTAMFTLIAMASEIS
jgi:hypothetical protein